jgi:hypothetical protein
LVERATSRNKFIRRRYIIEPIYMADEEQLVILQQGADAWNNWRKENPEKKIDLLGANLHGKDLSEMDFSRADLSLATLSETKLNNTNLSGAKLWWACLKRADLRKAILVGAKLTKVDSTSANFIEADLSEAILIEVDLTGANLSWANLTNAELIETDLSVASLVETNLEGAYISNCIIYGVSAWGLKLKGAVQKDLIITHPHYPNDPKVTVDSIEVAQFIYLLLNNENIRNVIDTITSKVVLILGRFTDERKVVLDAIREELRKRDYLPVLFDFDKPASRDIMETISTLAHMARFIIADITDAKSISAELQCIVTNLPSVPIMPLVLRSDRGYALFEHMRSYNSVLEPYYYESQAELIASLGKRVIAPAEAKVEELRGKSK